MKVKKILAWFFRGPWVVVVDESKLDEGCLMYRLERSYFPGWHGRPFAGFRRKEAEEVCKLVNQIEQQLDIIST